MSTYQLSSERGPAGGATLRARARDALLTAGAPGLLLGALLALVLYAAFAHGATAEPAEPRLQVALAAVAALAGGVWVWGAGLQARASSLAWTGVGLLAAFTIWSGVSLAWSVSPTGTWTEFNRYLTYTIVLVIAIVVGSSVPRARERLLTGFLAIAVLVVAYALGQKLLPRLHIPGVFDLNQTGPVPRLQLPFGYWNALGLFLVMAVPPALAVCTDRDRSPEARLGAVVLLELMFIVIAFTYSRGALVALAAAIIATLSFSRERLRSVLWLGMAGAGALVPLVVGLTRHALTTPRVDLSQRQTTGAEFAAVIAISVVALILAGRRLLAAEGRVTIAPARQRGIVRGLIALAGLLVLIGLIGITVSHRGLTGTISHQWHNFTNTQAISETNPNRLLSDKFGYRLLWWKEALRAFGARPVGGWGAGSFPVVHLLFRRNDLSVMQPHSVPLQFLAENGLIGAMLGIGAFVALLLSGTRAVRASVSPRERMIAAALLAAAIAYYVHAFYDWDSDIPGVTLPMLAFLGVLVGSAARPRRARGGPREAEPAVPGAYAHLPARAADGPPGLGGAEAGAWPELRIVGIVALTLAMCAFALSAALPSLAGSHASNAGVLAATGDLKRADQQAALATKLDPVSAEGLWLEATIALRLAQARGPSGNASGYLKQARTLIGQALARNPSDIQAWQTLVQTELLSHHLKAGVAAAQHILDLDPAGPANLIYAAGLAQGATLLLAPPQDSAAAAPTPQATGATGTTGTTGTTGVT